MALIVLVNLSLSASWVSQVEHLALRCRSIIDRSVFRASSRVAHNLTRASTRHDGEKQR